MTRPRTGEGARYDGMKETTATEHIAIADETNGFNSTIWEFVERTTSVRNTSLEASASGIVKVHPSRRATRPRNSSRSTRTIKRPIAADIVPTTVINDPPSALS